MKPQERQQGHRGCIQDNELSALNTESAAKALLEGMTMKMIQVRKDQTGLTIHSQQKISALVHVWL